MNSTNGNTYVPLTVELLEILLIGGGGGAPLLPPLVWSGDGIDGGRGGCECRDDGGGGGLRDTSLITEEGGAGGSLLGGGGGGCDWGVGGAGLQQYFKIIMTSQ